MRLDTPITDSLLPRIERFFHFKFVGALFPNPSLMLTKISEKKSFLTFKKRDWPMNGDLNSYSLGMTQFSISPISLGDEIYFHLISNYSTPFTLSARAVSNW
jgi:hypothetical protein